MKKLLVILSVLALFNGAYCLESSRGPVNKNGKIVGGLQIAIEQAPYQASLLMKFYHCGGVIVSKDFVLTVAHCVREISPEQVLVRVGSANLNQGGEEHGVDEIKIHPNYNAMTLDFDVSLLHLTQSINLDGVTKRAAQVGTFKNIVYPGTPVIISGWGETLNENEDNEQLRAVVLTTINHQKCHETYLFDGGITSRMFCASRENKDSCFGDSGGPVIHASNGNLVGLVSFGIDCANSGYPSVYTNLAVVRSWIMRYTRSKRH